MGAEAGELAKAALGKLVKPGPAISISPREGHQIWAASYDAELNPLLALEARTLAPLLAPLAGARVVDVACGTGRWLKHVRACGAQAVGIDFCAEMLASCGGGVALADAARMPFPDGFADVAICAFALGYLEPDSLAELARIVRRGGRVFVTDVHPAALERGWTRGFRRGGEVYQLRHRPYRLSDIIRSPGLDLISLHEPLFGDPERMIFEQAGKAGAFEDSLRTPAIFAAQWLRR
jgi:SAM-dependent methyltransferase